MMHDQLGPRILDTILSFVLEVTEYNPLNASPLVKQFISILHSKVIQMSSGGVPYLKLVKFAKCASSAQAIKYLKKIAIFVRERSEELKETSVLIREIIVEILSAAPNSTVYKEFFSFFREIFYYNKDMDEVDFDLACDTLQTMNQLLKNSFNLQDKEFLAVKGLENLSINV
jgi:hypothetical protein